MGPLTGKSDIYDRAGEQEIGVLDQEALTNLDVFESNSYLWP